MCKMLFTFDFDDTLVITPNAVINICDRLTNEKFSLNTHQWRNHFVDQKKYVYDWSHFNKLASNYEPIKSTLQIIKEIYEAYGADAIAILTARGDPTGPKEFLRIFNMPDIDVIALGAAANLSSGKANWIKQQIIDKKLSYVAYFEDNISYINEVKKLQIEFNDVIFNIQQIIF